MSTASQHPPTLTVETVQAFVDNEILPVVEDYDEASQVPQTILDRTTELGLWAPFLPANLGGLGMDMATLGQLHEQIGRGDTSLRSILTAHVMVAFAIHRWGTQEQRERWLPALTSGSLSSFCLTGAESGSAADVSGTIALPHGDRWTLSGQKRWTTSGQRSEVFLVFAHSPSGMTAFLVPRSTPGLRVIPTMRMLGARANLLAEIIFDGVQVGPDAVLGPIGWANGTVMASALALGRYSVAYGSVGLIQACLDECADYTARRRVPAGLLADQQLVRRMISDMVTKIRAARLLCVDVGRLRDRNDPEAVVASWIAKYFASTAAVASASDAVQIHGAQGCAPGSRVARLYRDAKPLEIIEGTSQLQQDTIAQLASPRGQR
jgi:alkylation response protein AidB-like acyl-CoA dehydrogenase